MRLGSTMQGAESNNTFLSDLFGTISRVAETADRVVPIWTGPTRTATNVSGARSDPLVNTGATNTTSAINTYGPILTLVGIAAAVYFISKA
jgi:hypothetical protein